MRVKHETVMREEEEETVKAGRGERETETGRGKMKYMDQTRYEREFFFFLGGTR